MPKEHFLIHAFGETRPLFRRYCELVCKNGMAAAGVDTFGLSPGINVMPSAVAYLGQRPIGEMGICAPLAKTHRKEDAS